MIATNLFANIPVRKQFYKDPSRRKEELKKIERYIAAFSIINPTVRKYRNRVEPLFDHTYLFLSLFMSMHLSLSSLRLKAKELYIAAICILYG